ncbi:MAG: diaminopimelate epimerase [Bacteroidia bacterium]
MKIRFTKYQGAGNDFVLIDNRNASFDKTDNALIAHLCDRRFGIGADGLMLLENKVGYDFEMVYFNADGNLSSMCGNGGRCIVDYAKRLGVTSDDVFFYAADGPHQALVKHHTIKLKMKDVDQIRVEGDHYFLDTGSPHYVKIVTGLALYDVFNEGSHIRHLPAFGKEGTNVNFIEREPGYLFVRTFERGVEDETMACGTGVTASALVAVVNNMSGKPDSCDVKTPGGKLQVYFKRTGEFSFTDIWLEGPAVRVFEGEIEC